MTHLSLSTEQLQTVLAGAARVPPQWRRRFLDDVADQLLAHLPTEDEIVSRAVQSTLQHIGVEHVTTTQR